MTVPPAASKLRLVLDYLPCEACLSQPVAEQELLCTVCRRLDREVDATVRTRALVLIERPTPAVVPLVAPLPPPLPPPAETPVPAPDETPAPLAEPAPAEPAPVEAAPAEPPAPVEQTPLVSEPAPQPAESVAVETTRDDGRRSFFGRFRKAPKETPPPEPVAEPAPEPAREPEPPIEAFAPPAEQTPAEAAPESAPEPQPEPATEPARAEAEAKRGFSLFRRKERTEPAAAPEAEPSFDDIVDYEKPDAAPAEEPAFDDVFTFTGAPEPREPERPADAVIPAAQELEDDFLYRAPEPAPEPEPLRIEEPPESLLPREEIPVEPATAWAPPEEDILGAFDAPAAETPPEEPRREIAWPDEPVDREPARPEETFVEMELLPDDEPAHPAAEPLAAPIAPEEDDIIETEIVEMEIVEDEPAHPASPMREPEAAPKPEKKRGGLSSLFRRKERPEAVQREEVIAAPAPVEEEREEVAPVAPAADAAWAPPGEAAALASETPAADDSDLYRLRGFQPAHREVLSRHGVETVTHLSGHDPVELSERTGLDPALVAPWVHVADLVQEVGVPLDSALALVAAGVEGPRGLRAMDADAIVDRVAAFGETSLRAQDVKRWKRRA